MEAAVRDEAPESNLIRSPSIPELLLLVLLGVAVVGSRVGPDGMGVGPDGIGVGPDGGDVGGDDVVTQGPEDTFFGFFASSYVHVSSGFFTHAARPSEHSP